MRPIIRRIIVGLAIALSAALAGALLVVFYREAIVAAMFLVLLAVAVASS